MKRVYDAANFALLLLLGLLVFSAYPRLPARIPTHFDLAGRPDGWSGRGGLIALFAVPLVMTVVLYLVARSLPTLKANPRRLNIPHKEAFLRLPADKQEVYWALLREFFAALLVATNLLFYLIGRGTVRIATGETGDLPFRAILPALVLLAALLAVYIRKMIVLPGKLVRGEE